jgi:NhaP-type Na+/H+ or K+/H+ antiporter
VVVAGITNASEYPPLIMTVIVATVIISAIGIPLFARKQPVETQEQLDYEIKDLKSDGDPF